MLKIAIYTPEGTLELGGEELIDRPGPKWIDLEQPDEPTLMALAQRFKLHRLAVEDCLHLDQRPKLEEYPNHLFVVIQSLGCPTADVCSLELQEMHLLLGPDWLISVHDGPSAGVAQAMHRLQAEPTATMGRGVDFIAYLIADALVDQHFPILDSFNDELEDLETRIFSGPSQPQLERIFQLKRTLAFARRVLSPQRDVIVQLTRHGIAHVQERHTLYFRDVYDHLTRLSEQVDAARDLVGNAMEGYLSMVANRTNEITKQLTIFASIFLPLSFVTGFFGQNFELLSRPHYLWGVLAITLFVPIALLGWFRHRGWI